MISKRGDISKLSIICRGCLYNIIKLTNIWCWVESALPYSTCPLSPKYLEFAYIYSYHTSLPALIIV